MLLFFNVELTPWLVTDLAASICRSKVQTIMARLGIGDWSKYLLKVLPSNIWRFFDVLCFEVYSSSLGSSFRILTNFVELGILIV